MTKDQAKELKFWCAQLEQAAAMDDDVARTTARETVIALIDEATEPKPDAKS